MNFHIKSISTLLFSCLLVFFNAGCEKSLIEKNKSNLTEENYFTNETQAQAAVNGIYPALQTLQTGAGLNYGEAPFMSIEFLVGHASTLGQSVFNNEMIEHRTSPTNPAFRVFWVGFYEGIANANLAINKIPAIAMGDSKKTELLGQAYFLRAFYYYYLVRLYGNIPLITEPIDFASPNLYPQAAPVQDVYDLIVSDLKIAEASGLPNVDKTGRTSIGAVKSLLSSVYLTMAGYPLNKGTEYFKLAADKSKEVLDANWYVLFDDYAYLHDRAHKNSGEHIFQVQYKTGIANNNITPFVTPDKIGISKLPSEIGALIPRNEFVKSYDKSDKRIQEQQFFFSEYPAASGTGMIKFGEYALYKFWLVEAAGPNGDRNSDGNWTLLRLPEVMLTYAEASNEVAGPTETAYSQVNLIRERASLPPLSGLTTDQFREAIWKERYHELAFENKAYFDVQRTRKAYNLAKGSFEEAVGYANESGVTFSERYMLWPIPQSEVDVNAELKQNPLW